MQKEKVGKNDRKEEIYYRYIYVRVFQPRQKTKRKKRHRLQSLIFSLSFFSFFFFSFFSPPTWYKKKDKNKKSEIDLDKGNNIIGCTK